MFETILRTQIDVNFSKTKCPDQEPICGNSPISVLKFVSSSKNGQCQIMRFSEFYSFRYVFFISC